MSRLPNILITGTPGTGKTTTSELLAIATNLKHVNIGDLVKQNQLHDGYDASFDTYILNEDKLLDEMEEFMPNGGHIVDFHSCELFPERWFDLVVVLNTNNTTLYDRLEKRGYTTKKIQENVECEIMQVVTEEAVNSYKKEIVWILQSDNAEQMEENILKIQDWIEKFQA